MTTRRRFLRPACAALRSHLDKLRASVDARPVRPNPDCDFDKADRVGWRVVGLE